mgnify:CR=1 FL=1
MPTTTINIDASGKMTAQMIENISFQDSNSSITAQTYVLELYAAYAYTINTLKIISTSGTCTAAVKINGNKCRICKFYNSNRNGNSS